MQWQPALVEGQLIRRYKRFLADVRLGNGEVVTAHCPNTGAMTGCAPEGAKVWLSPSTDPRRKTPFTWEMVEAESGDLVCIHSARANALVDEALGAGAIAELGDYPQWRREYRLPSGSRVDFYFPAQPQLPECLMEVKAVTLHQGAGRGAFPDAVSQRASRHVNELQQAVEQGQRAVLLFAVLHQGVRSVSPAADIDPHYAESLCRAVEAGVEVLAYRAELGQDDIRLVEALPFSLQ